MTIGPFLGNTSQRVYTRPDGTHVSFVETLGLPSVSRQLVATATSENTVLSNTATRASLYARGGNIRYSIGSVEQAATETSHFIAQGERIDILLPDTPNIAVLRADNVDCKLEVTEIV
jgi:hypothetical protein